VRRADLRREVPSLGPFLEKFRPKFRLNSDLQFFGFAGNPAEIFI